MFIDDWKDIDYASIQFNHDLCDENGQEELQMHTLHAYPAKFPAFIANAALQFASKQGVELKRVVDIFCGCGTVALETKRAGLDFWGCDINPVATLISRVKTSDFDVDIAQSFYSGILERYHSLITEGNTNYYVEANPRLQYWFSENNYTMLYCLLRAINKETEYNPLYRDAFLCVFSSILKSCSKWLQKSIKPQLDPYKVDNSIEKQFSMKYNHFIRAVEEINHKVVKANNIITIIQDNFLDIQSLPKTDLIITSPPYVTSYEYADLHQLSSLWLGYSDDYRLLRRGSIGSAYDSIDVDIDNMMLNHTARSIVDKLCENNCQKSRVKSIARYYSDMQSVISKSASMLNKDGMALFVIGDTNIQHTEIRNSQHLIECMIESGFHDIRIDKRETSKGICVPYRNSKGKFTNKSSSSREVYHEEYLISGRVS